MTSFLLKLTETMRQQRNLEVNTGLISNKSSTVYKLCKFKIYK